MKMGNLTETCNFQKNSQGSQTWGRLVPKMLSLPQADLSHTGLSGRVWCDVTILIVSWP